jgi:PAS domain S-box-containing protein
MIVGQLIENVALLVALAAVYDLVALRLLRGGSYSRAAAGLLFGIVSIIAMLSPLHFDSGIIYDSRTVILSAAGFIGGPVTAAIAAVLASAYRIWFGGIGTFVGTLTILEAAGLGTLFFYLRRGNRRWEQAPALLGFGLLVQLLQLLLQPLLPGDIWIEVLQSVGAVLLGIYPLAVALVIALFLQGERKWNAEQALRESEQRYRSLFDTSHSPMLLIDPADERIAEANAAAERFYGYRRDELRGKPYAALSAQPESEGVGLFFQAQRRGLHSFELQHIGDDGTSRTVTAFASTLQEGNRSYLYLALYDITRLREAELQLHGMVEEREMLLREINHRVKNNLAVILGLVNLQTSEVESREDARDALNKTRDRIMAMSSVHNLLYHSGDLARLRFPAYLRDVVNKLLTVYRSEQEILVEFELEELAVDFELAMPLALIVNEAVTNALKHAFPEEEGGRIRVELYSLDHRRTVLRILDNGRGLPPGAEQARHSLGLHLMYSLAQQVDGSLELRDDVGTKVELYFDRSKEEPAGDLAAGLSGSAPAGGHGSKGGHGSNGGGGTERGGR